MNFLAADLKCSSVFVLTPTSYLYKTIETFSTMLRGCRKSPLSHTRSEKVISSALLKCINACEAAVGMSCYPNEIQ